MKLVLDENIARPIVDWLRADGHDAAWIAEIAKSADDPNVLAIAAAMRRPLVTFDVGIGAQALRRTLNPPGIAVIRIDMSSDERAIANFKLAWPHAQRYLREGLLVTANVARARLKRLP